MNLFRSEEHIRNWSGFEPGSEDGIVPLDDLVKLFSGSYFRNRLDSDWVSRSREYARQMVKTFKEIGKTGPFWQLPR
jgi:two-component SAPR family response regulator